MKTKKNPTKLRNKFSGFVCLGLQVDFFYSYWFWSQGAEIHLEWMDESELCTNQSAVWDFGLIMSRGLKLRIIQYFDRQIQ